MTNTERHACGTTLRWVRTHRMADGQSVGSKGGEGRAPRGEDELLEEAPESGGLHVAYAEVSGRRVRDGEGGCGSTEGTKLGVHGRGVVDGPPPPLHPSPIPVEGIG